MTILYAIIINREMVIYMEKEKNNYYQFNIVLKASCK